MPTYLNLTFDPARWGANYYRDKYEKAVICRKALRKHVQLPSPCPRLRVVATVQEPRNDEWYRITDQGRLVDMRDELVSSFEYWLRSKYYSGYRYIYFDTQE